MTSLVSFPGGLTVPAYTAAKGDVAKLTKALRVGIQRRQYQRHGSRIHRNRHERSFDGGQGPSSEYSRKDFSRVMRQPGRTPVVFLASPASLCLRGDFEGGWRWMER